MAKLISHRKEKKKEDTHGSKLLEEEKAQSTAQRMTKNRAQSNAKNREQSKVKNREQSTVKNTAQSKVKNTALSKNKSTAQNKVKSKDCNHSSFALVWKLHKAKYLMIAPFALVFFTFTFLPVMVSIILSFTSFNMVDMPDFIGLTNYINLLVQDDIFLIAIKNTLILALVTGPISYMMCFLFAWLINELPRIPRAIMTLVFYAPSISGNAYLIWKLIFSSDTYGYANAWLMKLGITHGATLWFETAKYIMPILIIVQLWLSLGVSFLAFIAGLQNVDKSLYEAAAVEGTKNRWQELWYITLPSMKPQLMFGAVMQITSSLSISQISIDLVGFPSAEYAGHTILTHLHDYGNVRYELGYACTIAVVLFFIMVLCNIIVQKLLRKLG